MANWATSAGFGKLIGLMLVASLAACAGGPSPRPGVRTQTVTAPAQRVMPNSESYRMCAARLNAAKVRFEPLPNQDRGGGCTTIDTIRLLEIGTPIANLGPMTCPLAANFAAWVQYAVRPAARLYLRSEVVRVETFGTYACRDVRGTGGTIAGKRSEHAHANAVDISAFVLADGRRISLLGDWHAGGPNAQFLRVLHQSACKRFRTVLGPDYNAAHRGHFHFDMGGRGSFCR
ncbi:MAG: extensin family protein [Alphaproteobacteria bacterium]|nr:extensin family protein [Alphaproteobacteria bacterium]MBU0874723.1 extensin family protein [Alphaproteobacteria bacterium]MBU1771523.1 extensin family protein [Alphaproteobacteria bacterium]